MIHRPSVAFISFLKGARATFMIGGPSLLFKQIARYLGSILFSERFYSLPIVRSIRETAVEKSVFIDIGAHFGEEVTAVANQFSYCVAIEPSRDNVKQLRARIGALGLNNCKVYECALAEKEGSGELFVNPENSGDTSLVQDGSRVRAEKVIIRTLDGILNESQLNAPFVIKIDVQGYEVAVIEGGHNTLTKTLGIISEFWPYGIRLAGYSASYYLDLLSKYGFVPYWPNGRPFSHEILKKMCNVGSADPYVVLDILFLRAKKLD